MPVDAEPAEDGNLVLYDGDGEFPLPMAYPVTPFDRRAGDPLYVSHFSSCPQAEGWRK